MDDLERKLKTLSLGEPSPALRDRIFSDETTAAPVRNIRPGVHARRIPLAWGAAIALFCTALGYSAGSMRAPIAQIPEIPASTVRVEVIKTTNPKNMFDFTAPANDFLPGKVNVRVTSHGEV